MSRCWIICSCVTAERDHARNLGQMTQDQALCGAEVTRYATFGHTSVRASSLRDRRTAGGLRLDRLVTAIPANSPASLGPSKVAFDDLIVGRSRRSLMQHYSFLRFPDIHASSATMMRGWGYYHALRSWPHSWCLAMMVRLAKAKGCTTLLTSMCVHRRRVFRKPRCDRRCVEGAAGIGCDSAFVENVQS